MVGGQISALKYIHSAREGILSMVTPPGWQVLMAVITLCTQSAHLYAYKIYLAYLRYTYICAGVTVAKPSRTSG